MFKKRLSTHSTIIFASAHIIKDKDPEVSQNPTKGSENIIPIITHIEPRKVEPPTSSVNTINLPLTNVELSPTLKKPLRDLINDFLHERAYVGKKLKPNAISNYRRSLNVFADFMEGNNLPLTADSLKKYAEFIENCIIKPKNNPTPNEKGTPKPKEKNLAPQSKSSRRYALVSFLNYAVKNGWIIISYNYNEILQCRKSERTAEKPHIALTLTEANKLFNHVITLTSVQEILEILIPLLCGLRAMETVAIKKRNFDLANHQLKLTLTKNGLPRNIPLPEFVVKLAEQYLNNFNLDDYIFPSRQSKAISRKTLNNHIKNVVELAGLSREVTCHDLRATFATLQYYHGDGDIIKLKDYLGHKDINTTAGYVSVQKRQEQKNVISLDEIYQKWENALLTQIEGISNFDNL